MSVKFDPDGDKDGRSQPSAPLGKDPTPALDKKNPNAALGKAPVGGKKPTITLDFWDFAGQALYYTTHQFVCSSISMVFFYLCLLFVFSLSLCPRLVPLHARHLRGRVQYGQTQHRQPGVLAQVHPPQRTLLADHTRMKPCACLSSDA
jgi:hypothetical protein